LSNNAGGGQPLDAATRAFFEPRFGHDFGHVRVHADIAAAESAASVNALAYTVGRDIVFGAGQYLPGTVGGNRLLAHELSHVVQQTGGGHRSASGLMVQRQEAPEDDYARKVIKNEKIDVRAQLALLRLLRGPAQDREQAIEMIDEIEKDTLKGIFGDDLGKAVELASQRGKPRWELVPPDRDAFYINDGLLDAPVMVFKQVAGGFPRLDRALISAYRADPLVIEEQCPDSRSVPPSCTFTEIQRAALQLHLMQARRRAQDASDLLARPDGPSIALAVAGQMFDSEGVPDIAEINTTVNGTAGILSISNFRFACRTCGDPACHASGNVAFAVKPGQMPISICAFRLLQPAFVKHVRRTIIHEAVHLSGIDMNAALDEFYCPENMPECEGACRGKENADTWARYIDCLAFPPMLPPPFVIGPIPPFLPPPIRLPGLQ
jgi:hypothetical protein